MARVLLLVLLAMFPGRSGQPILRLETGLHTALIRSLDVSADGRLALTASEDKTARLWDVGSGKLLRILRLPVEAGKVGEVYTAALSPDGRRAVLGGWTKGAQDPGHRVYLADLSDGHWVWVKEAGPEVVNHVAFSPDGAVLVLHLGGTQGLRLLRASDGREMARDLDFQGLPFRGAFDASGRYAATALDGFLRLYDRDFKLLAKVRAPAPQPFGLAFHPSGDRLAVAYLDSPRVDVVDGATLAPRFTPSQGQDPLGVVAWSRDGQRLLASGGVDFGPRPNVLRIWEEAAQGPAREIPLARAAVPDLRALPDGAVAFAAQDPVWGVVEPTGAFRLRRASLALDLPGIRESFRVHPDGLTVLLPGQSQAFSIADLDFVPLESLGPEARSPKPEAQIDGWRDGTRPTINGREAPLEEGEVCRSRAQVPGLAVLGTDWCLRAFDALGEPRWKIHAPAAVWALAPARQGRLLVAFLADGTVRWFRGSDGLMLASLHVTPDRRWVLWSPGGPFATSVGGETLAGWQVDRAAQPPDFFPLAHFRDRFHRPALFAPLLETQDLQRLDVPRVDDLPPVVEILSPASGASLPAGPASFKVALRTHGAARPLKGFQIFLDGSRLAASRGLRAKQMDLQVDTYTLTVDLPGREAAVGFKAELEDGRVSEVAEVRLAGPAAAVETRAPRLRVLAVGVGRYANPRYDLQFPAKDAQDVVDLFKAQEGRLFRQVEVRALKDGEATEKAISAALADLAASSSPDAVTLLFFSSHGLTDAAKAAYRLVPHDYGKGSQGLEGSVIKTYVERTQGKVVMLMDTCHSGNVLGEGKMRGLLPGQLNRFINELVQTGPGAVVFSSSTGAQFSLESPAWNNGAFTKALREGLSGAADAEATGRVTTDMLDAWLRKRVPELTGGKQTPVLGRTEGLPGFPLSVSR